MSIPVPKPASYQRREREQREAGHQREAGNPAKEKKGGNGGGGKSPPPGAPLPVSGSPTNVPAKGPSPSQQHHQPPHQHQQYSGVTSANTSSTGSGVPGGNGGSNTTSESRSPPLAPKIQIPSPMLNPAPRSQQGTSPSLAPTTPPAPNTGTFRPPAPFCLGESAMASVPGMQDKSGRRIDPTKFKTDLCRNYEQTGQCTFKGCTFAHGADELRQPPKGGLHSGTSQLSPQLYVNHLADILLSEVNAEVQAHVDHQETNRRLELALREEQAARQKTLKELAQAEKELEGLNAESAEKDKILAGLKKKLKGTNLPLPPSAGGGRGGDGSRGDGGASLVGGVLSSPSK